MKEGLIASSYECPKCNEQMGLNERKSVVLDGFEWRCRKKGVNTHDVCRSIRKNSWFSNTLLDEDDSQTQENLAEQLNVDQSTVSRRLKAMGKIIEVGRWVPHELVDHQQENRKNVSDMLLAHYERKSYLHRIVTGDEKWIYFENPKRN
ncbi:mariner Mos1 transposase [Trichonephila clavipes]|nr:mariner Mos1 transposase [Trichonephila clavipes]